MIVEPLESADGDLPGPLLTELAALYASDHAFQQLSGEFPDPGAITPEQVAASLADELVHPGAEVLLARSAGRLVAVAVTLAHAPGSGGDPAPGTAARRTSPPDPADGMSDPVIGLLMVHGELRRAGYGRQLAAAAEERFRTAGRGGVRVAVPEDNSTALAFWNALGYEEIDRAPDRRRPDRSCAVLRKDLTRPAGS
ncbi:GNAT family N-acetyltransferase [Streptomyces fuscigenes]|uniref:GNAT family N-acetyltransferase n=1 Tax=Streptomyces fuscigenes TaxID=1528880 RepID=UPI001F1869F5|nr:GNAT family N-acetyltransferase [Streptomyces fuscigenes]MCF3960565.1 GNAT family N-acetyltransferase [Streptomyces fuscigenes]